MSFWTGKFIFNTATHYYDFSKVVTSQVFEREPKLLDALFDQVDPDKHIELEQFPLLIMSKPKRKSKQNDEIRVVALKAYRNNTQYVKEMMHWVGIIHKVRDWCPKLLQKAVCIICFFLYIFHFFI